MIRLGLRLTLNGGKEALVRLAITAAAVALGVGLLLVALAGMNALNAQNSHSAWLNTTAFAGLGPGVGQVPPAAAAPAPVDRAQSASDPLWWGFAIDHFGNQVLDRVDVAATGAHSPVPPGIGRLPGPGQFYASPALTRLLRTTPAAELADRFPGQQIGTIGPSALPSPNSLIVIVGHSPEEYRATPGASLVTSINTGTQVGGPTGWDANKLQTVLAVGALALLFPVLIFIGTATRLAAARREQRFAAMRLVGATPRQVAVISAVEASVAAFGGVALGFAVFFLLRPWLARVPFTGAPFAARDLSLGAVDVLLVAVGVPAAAAVAARVALRRVRISPLGVSRRATPPAPRAYRLIPLLAGLGELAFFVAVGRPGSTGGQILAYFSGCLVTMAGLVVAGPWLTMVGARVLAGRTSRPAALLAGRRLADNPRAAFRAISGLILALFATSVSVGIISTILSYDGTAAIGAGAGATLIAHLTDGPRLPGQDVAPVATVPDTLLGDLRSIPGVGGVTIVHTDPATLADRFDNTVLVSCLDLAATPALGRCAPGATVVRINGNIDGGGSVTSRGSLNQSVWPAASISAATLNGLPVTAIVVATNGSKSVVERARTTLEVATSGQDGPATLGEISVRSRRLTLELQQMAEVVIFASLVIAGCSLAVSVTAGVSDRKRPFSLLRLTGVPVAVLRRVVALEAAAPLVVIAALSTGTGLLAAALFLRSQLDESLRAPSVTYFAIVIGGLAASLAIIAATLPLIDRITGPETARNE